MAPVRLVVIFDPAVGQLQLEGEGDPLLTLAVLELAKAQIITQLHRGKTRLVAAS